MRLLKRLLILIKINYNGLPHNIKPYINHRTFKSSYRIYVFDTRYQNDHIGPQPIQIILNLVLQLQMLYVMR